jgi:geranylgeranyl diphosphate synthase type II
LILDELAPLRERVEAELGALRVEGLIEAPDRLREAARHALLAGGKRLRPLLALSWAEALGGSIDDAMPGALAVELIHTYSLVHDDLPALDDDDLRRGKPTVHKAFDEATAILAGDALLTDAFYVLAGAPRNAAAQCRELARAAGSAGMVGGQMRDMLGEQGALDLEELEAIHLGKTAALFLAACALGAWSATGDEAVVGDARAYAVKLGLAFQIADDVLDVVGDEKARGKKAGKDEARGKLTFVRAHGLERAREMAREEAEGAAEIGGRYSERLAGLARFAASRSA